MVYKLGETHSIFNQFIAEIRDEQVQCDSMRFRRNLERLGEIFAYEISKKLTYALKSVQTPLGVADVPVLADSVVLATILRAGLPMHQGMLNIFDHAENAFISAFRRYSKDGSFDIQIEYLSSPSVQDKIVILSDAMLATGSSIVLAYNELLLNGTPKHTHIVSAIGSAEGVEYLKKHLPIDKFSLWIGAVDEELTVRSYIVPGLGDAGDLAFGSKNDVISGH
jgi:uracil phosphoribosyltransferase